MNCLDSFGMGMMVGVFLLFCVIMFVIRNRICISREEYEKYKEEVN